MEHRQASVFRRAAVDRLATPEQFDRALSVVTPKAWLALATLMAMAVAVVVWSIRGQVSTFVQADGILLSSGGTLVDAAASNVGTLTRIVPAVGAGVAQGTVVAETTNQELTERHRSALALVDERARAVEEFKARAAAEDALTAGNLARQRERLRQLVDSGRQAVEVARDRLENHRQLFEARVVTRMTVERSQQAFDRAQRELFSSLRERDDLEYNELRRQSERTASLTELESRLQEAERRVNELGILIETQHVLAPVSGRVTEIKAPIGAVLSIGQPVLSIKTGAQSLEVLIYIPPVDGKRIKPGMEALISPATVRREEYGSLQGTVENVSGFPVSLDGMVAVLQNQSLAEAFSEDGPPYSGRVALVPDPATASGFAWTSPKGAGETLTSGTLASVEVKVDSQPPITLVVPLLKETFGL